MQPELIIFNTVIITSFHVVMLFAALKLAEYRTLKVAEKVKKNKKR